MTLKSLKRYVYFGELFNVGNGRPNNIKKQTSKKDSLKGPYSILTICPGKILGSSWRVPLKHCLYKKESHRQIDFRSDPEKNLRLRLLEKQSSTYAQCLQCLWRSLTLPKAVPNPTFTWYRMQFQTFPIMKKICTNSPAKTIFPTMTPRCSFEVLNKSGKGRKKIVEIERKLVIPFEVLSRLTKHTRYWVGKAISWKFLFPFFLILAFSSQISYSSTTTTYPNLAAHWTLLFCFCEKSE